MGNDFGWVRINRALNNNDIWFLEPFTKGQAWIDLILNANHKDGVMNIRGNIIPIKRGQLGWSELTMSKRWKWSKNKTRRFLKWLEVEQQIEQQKTFITSIITILNYEKFQSDDTADDTAKRQQKDSRRYINKNEKNEKNEKNILNINADKSAQVVEVIPDLLVDKQRHIQIIGLFAKAQGVVFSNKDEMSQYIKRNLRPATALTSLKIERIIEVMKWLIDNADFKWTLETIPKYYYEDLSKIGGSKKSKIVDLTNL
jgi:hypothetical protein